MKIMKWLQGASETPSIHSVQIDSLPEQNSTTEITILIVDDHALIRENWVYIFTRDPRFQVVGQCGSGEEAIELSRNLQPEVVLMDIRLPGICGIEATTRIINEQPATSVIGVSLHAQPYYARKMMQQGARGYVTKNSPRTELFQAIMEVHEGKKFICEEVKNILSEQVLSETNCLPGVRVLSAQEIRIIGGIKNGCSSREISQQLNISEKTVDVYRYNILKKLNLKNTAALVDYINHSELLWN